MKSCAEILNSSREYLESKGLPAPRRLAEEILSDVLQLSRMDLYMSFDQPLTDREVERCHKYIKRLGEGEPLQYIRGYVDFFNCHIHVTPDVLIPRPETELLVEKFLKINPQGTVWDICCGSGCVGIAIKKQRPELTVILSDVSESACTIARKNAVENGVDVKVRCGDLFASFENEMCDYLISNPPYISEVEYVELDPFVKSEPKLALVADDDGNAIYKRFEKELSKYVRKEAWFELGKPVIAGEVMQDYAGKDRFLRVKI